MLGIRNASRRLCSVTSSHYARAADVYDSAPFYSTAERNHETLVGLVVDRLALRAEHRLVDIGAGNGAFTDSLVQRVGGERATIVEPSKEFMTGVHAYPSIVPCTRRSKSGHRGRALLAPLQEGGLIACC